MIGHTSLACHSSWVAGPGVAASLSTNGNAKAAESGRRLDSKASDRTLPKGTLWFVRAHRRPVVAAPPMRTPLAPRLVTAHGPSFFKPSPFSSSQSRPEVVVWRGTEIKASKEGAWAQLVSWTELVTAIERRSQQKQGE